MASELTPERARVERIRDAQRRVVQPDETILFLLRALDAAEARIAALEAAARHAIDGLADAACVHGAEFNSNEYPDWDSYCDVCAAMRPLVRALEVGREGES